MLIDPNTDDTIVYGDEIVPYLWEAYGPLYGELDVTVVEARMIPPPVARANESRPASVQLQSGADVNKAGHRPRL